MLILCEGKPADTIDRTRRGHKDDRFEQPLSEDHGITLAIRPIT